MIEGVRVKVFGDKNTTSGLILGFRPANERRRYFVTTPVFGWAQTWNQPCNMGDGWMAFPFEPSIHASHIKAMFVNFVMRSVSRKICAHVCFALFCCGYILSFQKIHAI